MCRRSSNPSCYEEDHLISPEIGGNPRDPDNLWPQPWFGTWNAMVKDKLENKLHRMVCSGDITLAEAQQAIAKDWIAAYQKYCDAAAVEAFREVAGDSTERSSHARRRDVTNQRSRSNTDG